MCSCWGDTSLVRFYTHRSEQKAANLRERVAELDEVERLRSMRLQNMGMQVRSLASG